ncbi:MAG TPA: Holliday junction resolvase RuvX [Steroidobacteraceae bacterium]|jgi:putative Holliday junction resolvase|nr:Holliday junction resolvase RuvX [Steroidobacteraceae bacterium]
MPEGRSGERPAHVVLGFDFGSRRIGIASGDTVTATAAPCATVAMTDRGADWAAIERLLQQFQPDLLVVGSPRHADGSDSARSGAAERFAAELARRSGLTVQRVDEYASSIEAGAALKHSRASGTRRRRVRHADIDSAAAAIILQRWLQGGRSGA